MITTTQAIEALRTLQEYCIQRGTETCKTCPFDSFCEPYHGIWFLTPDEWKIPQKR